MAVTPDSDQVAEALDDPRIEAFGMLLEAHNELRHELERRTEARAGIPSIWLGVLIALARSPDQQLRMNHLARDMTMSTSGLTRLIDRIEAAGLVRREACPEDRRGLWAVLTDDGRALLAEVAPHHLADLQDLIMGALDAGEMEELTDLLRRLRNHVRDRTAHR